MQKRVIFLTGMVPFFTLCVRCADTQQVQKKGEDQRARSGSLYKVHGNLSEFKYRLAYQELLLELGRYANETKNKDLEIK